MFFSGIISFAVLSLSIISAAATPAVPIKPRDNVSGALAVVNNLKSTTDGILPQINTLVAQKAATQANISPLLANLVVALNTATSSLQGLRSRDITTSSSGSAQDVANAVAPVVTNIANTLNNLKVSQPALAPLVDTGTVGTALGKVVVALNVVVVGVTVLLDGLLTDVAIVLGGGLLGILGL